MKALTAEWVSKAEDDWDTGLVVFRRRKSPKYDHACFHAQQCAEKYLKALLVEEGIAFPKTHDLRCLLNMLPIRNAAWEALRPSLANLSEDAVICRYPGEVADKAAAKESLATARLVRALARKHLDLPA
ncbi:MAG: HEPN domain-containing protein [Planctomycetota bacterium]